MLHNPATVELYLTEIYESLLHLKKYALLVDVCQNRDKVLTHVVGRDDGLTSMKHVLLSYINITQREMCTMAIPGAASHCQ